MFDISISDAAIQGLDSGENAVYSTIIIGDFYETFYTSLVSWTRERYQSHWQAALARIIAGAERSALIASYVEPKLSKQLMWWPLYREANDVYIQNHLLFFDHLSLPFSADHAWDFVRDRQTINSEGQRISEWCANIDSLHKFLSRIKQT
jgi:hypothetical protein